MKRLEQAAHDDRLTEVFEDECIIHEASSPAIRALLVSEPSLGEVADRLIRLEPGPTPVIDTAAALPPLPVAGEP